VNEDRPRYDVLLWKNKIWESRVSNTGDLAIIRNTCLKLREQIPDARVHILSDDPEYVAAEYGVVAHPIGLLRRPFKLAALLRRIDLVILGGGTVFQDNYFIGVIPINLSIPLLAKAMGARVLCNAVGVGSPEEMSAFGRLLCRLAVRRFDSISVRDIESKRTLERWTNGGPRVHLTNDIAVDLPDVEFAPLEAILREEGVDLASQETVAIAARKVFHHDKSWLYFLPSSLRHRLGLQSRAKQRRLEEFKDTLAGFCDYIIERYGVTVLFVPFYSSGGAVDSRNRKTPTRLFSSGDNVFAEEVAARIRAGDRVRILARSYSPEELLTIIGRCKALVGVPYHSVVFASSRNVPVIGINYVSKVGRYLRILGLEEFAVDPRASVDLLTEKFDRLWRERDRIAQQLRSRNDELRVLADRNIRIIRNVLLGDGGVTS
jgi:polysaccharide pyruvyl transferase WcaK-like protein